MIPTNMHKGQSAIEYLTTYGWALLAIIIVGAVLVNMGVFNQCQKTTPRFSGTSAAIETWEFTGTNEITMSVQAINQDLTVNNVTVSEDGSQIGDATSIASANLAPGGTTTVTVDTGSSLSSGECASMDVGLNVTITALGQPSLITGSGKLAGPVP